jgi:hypothetical protein
MTWQHSLHTLKTRLTRPVMGAAAALAIAGAAAPSAAAGTEARLRETARGCALLTPDGRVLFAANGPGARAACLQRARETGVLRIIR